ncbi:MAG: SsrA-binding protein SmpB [Candidatus Cloacimonetes bacterium]|nr:SsrA-binding protein SmpB [Candidatus Cloacimonadota bacterium]
MSQIRIVNRKARHDYMFLDELEAGIVLKGTEIKSIRAGNVSFKDSHARMVDGEMWLYSLHISPYEMGNQFNHEPERRRKLLLNRREMRRLQAKMDERGLTLIPRAIYINKRGLAKVSLALARGKHNYDKREALQKRDQERDLQRRLKDY